jgi:hypothetical protein
MTSFLTYPTFLSDSSFWRLFGVEDCEDEAVELTSIEVEESSEN